ncbi:MAG: NifU family protein [Alphaproteobacteria bacterium]
MSIEFINTPNPAALKFLPGQPLLSEGTESLHITPDTATSTSPLATRIFALGEHIHYVLLGPNFITVGADERSQWTDLAPIVSNVIETHLKSGGSVLNTQLQMKAAAREVSENTDPYAWVVDDVKHLLDTKVRPGVETDGGKITFSDYSSATDRIVYLSLQGACDSCPSAVETLRDRIEKMLIPFIGNDDAGQPLIKGVRQIGDAPAPQSDAERMTTAGERLVERFGPQERIVGSRPATLFSRLGLGRPKT